MAPTSAAVLKKRFQKNNKDVYAYDFLISLFMSALRSYKHDTLLRPFPPMFYSEDTQEKDFDLLKASAEEILPLDKWEDTFGGSACEDLMTWLLDTTKPFTLHTMDDTEVNDLKGLLEDACDWKNPSWVFEVIPNDACQKRFNDIKMTRSVFLAYHGSRLENFYSILHHGLACHLNKNGLFGEGTYLSGAISVSLHFSPHGPGWLRSCLSEQLSCVAVCEIIDHPSVKCHTKDPTRSRIAHSEGGQIPDKYYVVTNNEVVRVKYLLVYHGSSSKNRCRPTHRSWLFAFVMGHKLLFLMLLYIVLLIAIRLFSNSRSFFNKPH